MLVTVTIPESSDEDVARLRAAAGDSQLMQLRVEYCETVTRALESTSSWLGIDSYFGGGELSLAGLEAPSGVRDDTKYFAWRGVSAMIEMAGQLAYGAVKLFGDDRQYAAAALVRQLIETEYFLALFLADFEEAANWYHAIPAEVRRRFSVGSLRSRGGFRDREYWSHCDQGGHPSPAGHTLLRHGLHVRPQDESILRGASWVDLAQHLRRIWRATTSLLAAQHPRFEVVRASEIAEVRGSEIDWTKHDPLA